MNSYNKNKIHHVDSRTNIEEIIRCNYLRKLFLVQALILNGEGNQEVNEIYSTRMIQYFLSSILDSLD